LDNGWLDCRIVGWLDFWIFGLVDGWRVGWLDFWMVGHSCKNYQRRIKTYRYYVDKNFEDLSIDYIFFGRNKSKANTFVQYIPDNQYDDILVYKKK
jgi:hypothetical protein